MQAALLRFGGAFAVAATAAALNCARAEEAGERAAPRRQCYSTPQSREKIEVHKLTDPFSGMRAVAQELNGEALGAKLCRLEELLVYEISVLRRDGHIVRVLLDAFTGRPPPPPAPAPAPRKE
jgi:hypothetical protein